MSICSGSIKSRTKERLGARFNVSLQASSILATQGLLLLTHCAFLKCQELTKKSGVSPQHLSMHGFTPEVPHDAEEMAKMEEKGGEEWTDEKKVEYERKVTGKILMAAWRGSKFEIQSVLRYVHTHIYYFTFLVLW